MKTEIARVQKLEGTVTDISKEANKLAVCLNCYYPNT